VRAAAELAAATAGLVAAEYLHGGYAPDGEVLFWLSLAVFIHALWRL
jgi:hypothetical protein